MLLGGAPNLLCLENESPRFSHKAPRWLQHPGNLCHDGDQIIHPVLDARLQPDLTGDEVVPQGVIRGRGNAAVDAVVWQLSQVLDGITEEYRSAWDLDRRGRIADTDLAVVTAVAPWSSFDQSRSLLMVVVFISPPFDY